MLLRSGGQHRALELDSNVRRTLPQRAIPGTQSKQTGTQNKAKKKKTNTAKTKNNNNNNNNNKTATTAATTTTASRLAH